MGWGGWFRNSTQDEGVRAPFSQLGAETQRFVFFAVSCLCVFYVVEGTVGKKRKTWSCSPLTPLSSLTGLTFGIFLPWGAGCPVGLKTEHCSGRESSHVLLLTKQQSEGQISVETFRKHHCHPREGHS